MDTIFQIAILIMSIVVHETSHGFVALWLGDYTAKMAGRLTLNPIKHIDLFGSIIVPIITALSGFTFGWAKPVPYNPYNLKWRKWGDAAVAGAGPLSNILIAVFFGLLARISINFHLVDNPAFYQITLYIVIINLVLAIFNLVPIPPLDGSKLVLPFLSSSAREKFFEIEKYGFFIVFAFVIFLGDFVILPVVSYIFRLISGL